MSISANRLEKHEKFTAELQDELAEELAAVGERVQHLENLLGTDGASSEKLVQHLDAERERLKTLTSALAGCDQVLTRLRSYAELG